MKDEHYYRSIEVGHHVEDLACHKGLRGTVIEVTRHNVDNPVVEHGSVIVLLDPDCVSRFPCSPPNEEHYVEYQWWKTMKVLGS